MAEYDDNTVPGLETPADLGETPQATVRRWLLELRLADKRELDWRKSAQMAIDLYKGAIAKKNSFNILWSNTETLLPAVYSSVPKPDVRRRYKDNDPLGKAVSEVVSRALDFSLDTYDFDGVARSDVMDMLLAGRGVSWVRYVPSLSQVGLPDDVQHDEEAEDAEVHQDEGGEALEGGAEEVEWEQTIAEHVQWDDFRIGPGDKWIEVPWVARRHRLKREDLIEQFGHEIGQAVQLDATTDDDINKMAEHEAEPFKTAEVWEIWCKDSKKVYFICAAYKKSPLKTVDDPLQLKGFFPCPKPLYAIEDVETLVPITLYEQYKEQAEELNRISVRINKIIDALKLRGVYDATIAELSELMRGTDNDLIPAQNVSALIERGGLDKVIWTTEALVRAGAQVLAALYQQRDATKQTIYEITGMSDILRGASNPNETATAQQIKSQWGSLRVKRIQADIARYLRDLLRIKAEIISQKFQQQTLAQMTLVQLPTQQEAIMQAVQAQQQGKPFQMPITWEQVMQVMRSDMSRTYRIDVETDSTIAASLEADMQGLREVLTGVVQFIQGIGPAVQAGAMPVEAVKEIIMAVVRRARMGSAVEDALDKMQQPQAQGNPQAAAQTKQLQDQVQQLTQQLQQAQQQAQGKQAELQANMSIEQMRMQADVQLAQMKEERASQAEQAKMEREAMLAQQKLEFDRWKAQLEADTKIMVAQLSAQTSITTQQIAAEQAFDAVETNDD